MSGTQVTCPYCGTGAKLMLGRERFPKISSIADRFIWICASCDAYAVCPPNSRFPSTALADSNLRQARQKLQSAFDGARLSRGLSRNQGREWLAQLLDIPPAACRINHFTLDEARRALDIVMSVRPKLDR